MDEDRPEVTTGENPKEEKPKAVRLRGIEDVPPLAKKVYAFEQNGQRFEIEFSPLTAEQMEDIRAAMPLPDPPEKPITGPDDKPLSAPEKIARKRQGLPLTYRDYNDLEYEKSVRQHSENFAFELVRTALGSDLPSEEFGVTLRSRLTAGTLQSLIEAVQNETFRLDAGVVENLSRSFPPSTGTGGGS